MIKPLKSIDLIGPLKEYLFFLWTNRRKSRFFFWLILLNLVIYLSLNNLIDVYRFVSAEREYSEGDIIQKNLVSPKDLHLSSLEKEEAVTNELIETAVPPIYSINIELTKAQQVDFVEPKREELSQDEEQLLKNIGQMDRGEKIEERASLLIQRFLDGGVFPPVDEVFFSPTNQVLLSQVAEERVLNSENLPTKATILKEVEVPLEEEGFQEGEIAAIRSLIEYFLQPNVNFESQETQKRRTRFRKGIIEKSEVKILKGDPLLEEGDVFLSENKRALSELSWIDFIRVRNLNYLFVGQLLILLYFFSFSSLFSQKRSTPRYAMERSFQIRRLALVASIPPLLWLLTTLISTQLNFLSAGLGSFALIVSYTYRRRESQRILLAGSLLLLLFSRLDGTLFVQTLILFTLADFLARNVQTRLQIFYNAFWLAFLLRIIQVLFDKELFFQEELFLAQFFFDFGAMATIVFLLLPLLETFFRLATPFRLIELGDMNRPVFKSLLERAPGTYNHSLQVANLAQELAKKMGADDLLCRIAGYYHDIGKIDNAEYFVENQTGENPHDKMEPKLSTTIIKSHVKLGVERAKKLRLPNPIVELIKQHHGDGVIRFFYEKAKEADKNPNLADYRYAGPKPQSREAAILLLSDSVEAASRTIDNPTHANLKLFIDRLLINIYTSNQLDETDFTFSELSLAGETFSRILASFYHSRIKYPEQRDTAQKKEEQKREGVPLEPLSSPPSSASGEKVSQGDTTREPN